ncbi:hypothetical protein APUTEX25_003383, partial [Auxenochlorella protothecoides]
VAMAGSQDSKDVPTPKKQRKTRANATLKRPGDPHETSSPRAPRYEGSPRVPTTLAPALSVGASNDTGTGKPDLDGEEDAAVVGSRGSPPPQRALHDLLAEFGRIELNADMLAAIQRTESHAALDGAARHSTHQQSPLTLNRAAFERVVGAARASLAADLARLRARAEGNPAQETLLRTYALRAVARFAEQDWEEEQEGAGDAELASDGVEGAAPSLEGEGSAAAVAPVGGKHAASSCSPSVSLGAEVHKRPRKGALGALLAGSSAGGWWGRERSGELLRRSADAAASAGSVRAPGAGAGGNLPAAAGGEGGAAPSSSSEGSLWASSLVCADLTLNDVGSQYWPFRRAGTAAATGGRPGGRDGGRDGGRAAGAGGASDADRPARTEEGQQALDPGPAASSLVDGLVAALGAAILAAVEAEVGRAALAPGG